MKFYTKQNRKVLQLLKNDGVVRSLSCKSDDFFTNAYQYMYDKLNEKKSVKKQGFSLFWGVPYQKYVDEMARDGIVLEFEIPDDLILISDYCAWHWVLNDSLFSIEEDDSENLSENEKKESWEKIFDITYNKESNQFILSKELSKLYEKEDEVLIQLCVYELKLEWLKRVYD